MIAYKGMPVINNKLYTIGIQDYYYLNSEVGLGFTPEQLAEHGGLKTAAADAFEVLKSYLAEHRGAGGSIDKRFRIRGTVRGERRDLLQR